MKYTYKKLAGFLCILLSTVILSRFIPVWLFYFMAAVIFAFILYFLYYCFYR